MPASLVPIVMVVVVLAAALIAIIKHFNRRIAI